MSPRFGLGLGFGTVVGAAGGPPGVSDLVATAAVGDDPPVTLEWSDVAGGETYDVIRLYDDRELASVAQGVEQYVDSDPFSAIVLNLTIARLDGGSGTVTTSNGILLPAGALATDDLANVALWINGVEVACYLEVLSGLHIDGTVLSLLLQTSVNPATVSTAQIRIGVAATVSRLIKTAIADPVPNAVLFPSSADDLIVLGTFPRVVSVADMPAAFATYDTVLDGWSTLRREGASPLSFKWDRAMVAFYAFIRRGCNATTVVNYFKWACENVEEAQAQADALTPQGATSPQNQMIEGNLYHYWLTGFERSREYCGIFAQRNDHLGYLTTPNLSAYYPDPRIWQREILSYVLAIRCDSTGHYEADGGTWPQMTTADWIAKLNAAIDWAVGSQIPSGSQAGLWYYSPFILQGDQSDLTESIFYMCGMIADAMAQAVDFLEADLGAGRVADVIQSVAAFCDGMWPYYSGAAKATQYLCTASDGVIPDDSQVPVTAMQINLFGWAYRKTGESRFKTRGDTLMAALCVRMDTSPYLTYGGGGNYQGDEQAFNECFTTSSRYPGEVV